MVKFLTGSLWLTRSSQYTFPQARERVQPKSLSGRSGDDGWSDWRRHLSGWCDVHLWEGFWAPNDVDCWIKQIQQMRFCDIWDSETSSGFRKRLGTVTSHAFWYLLSSDTRTAMIDLWCALRSSKFSYVFLFTFYVFFFSRSVSSSQTPFLFVLLVFFVMEEA